MKLGFDYYSENGYKVFTKAFLLKRGFCCKNGCRHCAWNFKYNNKEYNKMNKEDLFVDMDGVLADFEGAVTLVTGKTPEDTDWQETKDKLSEQPGFYLALPPIDGAVEAFKKLSEHYNMHILSTPSWDNPSSYSDKRLWVEKHLGEYGYKKLTLTHDKSIANGRALIDDRTKNGAAEFKGEHIHFATEKFPNWDAVLKYLMP
jgi:5'(3')-deoxyribonucleotidase